MEQQVAKKRKCSSGSFMAKQRKFRIAGEAYQTSSKKNKPAKRPHQALASCKCKYKCNELSEQHKLDLFTKFYSCDERTQKTYLMGLFDLINIQRRRHGFYNDPSESRRQASVTYHVPNGKGENIQLSFKPPRSDTCRVCDELQCKIKSSSSATESTANKGLLELHQRKAEKAMETLKQNAATSQLPGSNISTICIDLQQINTMPRSYIRKNLRGQWSEEDLQNAVRDIIAGTGSVREISRIYKVPVRTLMRRNQEI
ncbi:hypothetical protein NQ314_010592 [Rhamnusium bicolor]|uniref:HTH psq-type domain-containing protein n=1 Tax=Rhamnusium bicolor TaxID=1586634 RepID=A0AAV8XPA5_9CUCU|nr:hypothetical protein NQ314_010592 [Rhamnusium bicolor]